MIAYKVVHRNTYSYIRRSITARGDAEVIYSTDEFAQAPKWLASQGYHLVAYLDLETARNFANKLLLSELWEAECEEQVTPPGICSVFAIDNGELVPWEDPEWPEGTAMFKRIKLLREIE